MRVFLISLLIILIGILATGYFLYKKLNYLPEWYTAEKKITPVERLLEESTVVKRNVTNSKNPIILNNQDLSALILSEVKNTTNLNITESIKAIKTRITEQSIHVDLILDIHKLDRSNFPARTNQVIDQVTKWIPEEALSNLYLNLKLIPEKERSVLRLNEASSITLWGLEFHTAQLKERLNLSDSLFRERWSDLDIILENDRLILKR